VSPSASPAAGSSSISTRGFVASARDLDQPAIDVRQLAGCAVDGPAIADEREQRRRERARRSVVAAHERAMQSAERAAPLRDQHVLEHREPGEELRRLERARDAGARDKMRHAVRKRLFTEAHRAAVGSVEAADEIEQRRLAGAVRPDDARHFTGLRGERYVANGLRAAERDAESLDREPARRGAVVAEECPDARVVGFRCARHGFAHASLDRADDPLGDQPQHEQQQRAEEEQSIFGEERQDLGQQHDDERARDRAEHRARAADQHDEQERDRLEERERLGTHEIREDRENRSCDAGEERRDDERYGANRDEVEADRLARGLRVARRAHREAPRAVAQAIEEHEQHREQREREHTDAELVHGQAEERRPRDVHDPVPATGEPLHLGGALLDDEAERDRDHREVGAAHAKRRDREKRARNGRREAGERQHRPETPFVAGREDRARIRADRVEADVAERKLPGEAEQHVEADADDRGDRDHRDHVLLIAVGEIRRGRGDEREGRDRRVERRRAPSARLVVAHRGQCRDRQRHLHTFFTPARPNRPSGRSASATMTRPNVRICVYVDPNAAVISDSALP
jgi:hypothetical protein